MISAALSSQPCAKWASVVFSSHGRALLAPNVHESVRCLNCNAGRDTWKLDTRISVADGVPEQTVRGYVRDARKLAVAAPMPLAQPTDVRR